MKKDFDPNIGKATQFSATNPPRGAGRKKTKFNYLKSEYELSQEDLKNIINYLSNITKEEFDLMKNDKEQEKKMPMIVYKLMAAYDKSDLDDIIKLMKASGKAPDKSEITIEEIIVQDDDNL